MRYCSLMNARSKATLCPTTTLSGQSCLPAQLVPAGLSRGMRSARVRWLDQEYRCSSSRLLHHEYLRSTGSNPPPRTVRNKVGAPGTKSARCDMRCQAGSHPWKGGDQPWGALHPLTRTHVPHPRATLWGFAVFSPRAGGGSQEEAPLGSNPVLPEAVSSHHHDGRDPSIAAGTASHQACGETATASVGQWPSATHTSTSNTAARSVGKSTASARPSGP